MLCLRVVLLVLITATALAAEEDQSGWEFASENSLQIKQMALSNWAAGDESMWGLTGDINPMAVYTKGRFHWHNYWKVKYGLYKTESYPLQKIEDYLSINSILEYKIDEHLSLGGLVRLHSQIAPGYSFDIESQPKISNFLSPGYLLVGAGAQFKYRPPRLLIQLSPATLKETLVLDEDVRAFSQDPDYVGGLYGNNGQRVRHQVGAFSYLAMKLPVMENVFFILDSQFFFVYADTVLDVDAHVELKGKINKYLQASLSTRLLYDEDYDTDLEKPGKQRQVQLKEVLGLKLVYGF